MSPGHRTVPVDRSLSTSVPPSVYTVLGFGILFVAGRTGDEHPRRRTTRHLSSVGRWTPKGFYSNTVEKTQGPSVSWDPSLVHRGFRHVVPPRSGSVGVVTIYLYSSGRNRRPTLEPVVRTLTETRSVTTLTPSTGSSVLRTGPQVSTGPSVRHLSLSPYSVTGPSFRRRVRGDGDGVGEDGDPEPSRTGRETSFTRGRSTEQVVQ